MDVFIHWGPSVLYGLVAVLHLLWLVADVREEGHALLRLVLGAVLVHMIALVVQWAARGRLPFASMGETLSVSALVLAASYAFLEWKVRTTSLGVFFVGPVFVAMLFSSTVASSISMPSHLRSPLFALHAATGAAALAVLFASSLLGGAYLLQYRQLVGRRFGTLARRLPALPTLEQAFRLCGVLGTVLLLLSVAAGTLWIARWNHSLGNAATKTAFVCFTVVWFSVATLLGRRRSFTTTASARLAMLGGFLVLLVILVGAHG